MTIQEAICIVDKKLYVAKENRISEPNPEVVKRLEMAKTGLENIKKSSLDEGNLSVPGQLQRVLKKSKATLRAAIVILRSVEDWQIERDKTKHHGKRHGDEATDVSVEDCDEEQAAEATEAPAENHAEGQAAEATKAPAENHAEGQAAEATEAPAENHDKGQGGSQPRSRNLFVLTLILTSVGIVAPLISEVFNVDIWFFGLERMLDIAGYIFSLGGLCGGIGTCCSIKKAGSEFRKCAGNVFMVLGILGVFFTTPFVKLNPFAGGKICYTLLEVTAFFFSLFGIIIAFRSRPKMTFPKGILGFLSLVAMIIAIFALIYIVDGRHEIPKEEADCVNVGHEKYYKDWFGHLYADRDGTQRVDKEDMEIPPTGQHTYDPDSMPGEVVWPEAEGGIVSCKLKYTCTVCGEQQEQVEEAKEDEAKRVNPTCNLSGRKEYIAIFTIGGKSFQYNTTYEQLPLGHDTQQHASNEATCETNGNIEYWYCSRCGKYFSDSSYEQEIEQNDTVLKALGHKYDPSKSPGEWEWFGYSAAKLKYVCADCGEPQEEQADNITNKETEKAKCEETGCILHEATVTIRGKSFSDSVEEIRPALGHDYRSFKTKSPTWTEEGYTLYTCQRCSKYKKDDEVAALLEFSLSEEDGRSYSVSKCNITQKTPLEIPDTYNGFVVSSIDANVFSDNEFITSIILSAHITDIGRSAFSGCTSVQSVDLSQGQLNRIGDSAFSGCSALKSVLIPDSVTSIGEAVFSGCSGLKSLTIPFVGGSRKTASVAYQYPLGYFFGTTSFPGASAVEQVYYGSGTSSTTSAIYYIPDSLQSVTVTEGDIPSGAFEQCSRLQIVTIEDNVTSIGSSAFEGCDGLTSIEIPASVTSIGSSAFRDCIGLLSATVGNGSIAERVFYGCSRLASVVIGSGVSSIGNDSFTNCNKLIEVWNYSGLNLVEGSSDNGGIAQYAKHVYTEKTPSKQTVEDDYLFYEEGDEAYLLGYVGESTELTLPTSSPSGKSYAIWQYAFEDCDWLTGELIIPDSVKSIGAYAFFRCKGLKSLTLGDGVTLIGWDAFRGCSGLQSVLWKSENCTTEGGYFYSIFDGCNDLKTVTFGDNVKAIPAYAFYNCSSIEKVTIGSGMTSIGDQTFYNCYALEAVYITDLAAWCKITFSDFYANPLYYANHLYVDNDEVKNIVIPAEITTINAYAFDGGAYLTSVQIPFGVTAIEKNAFYNCKKLTDIIIPESIISIGEDAFYNCLELESVAWNASNCTTAGSSRYPIFEGCTNLKTATFGENVKTIPAYAFSGCSSLTSVIIPNSVTSIGEWVFNGCTSLTISCEAKAKPNGWDKNWNPGNRPVVWGYKAKS